MTTARGKPKRPRKPMPFKLLGEERAVCLNVPSGPKIIIFDKASYTVSDASRLRDWLTRWLEWAEAQR